MSESESIARMPEDVSMLPREQAVADASSKIEAVAVATRQKLLQRIFSFPAMLGAVIVGAVAVISRTFFVDPDVWWHIKNGQTILATHQWPTTDPYSFSVAGQHWIAFEWIGDALLAVMYRLGGMRGLELLLLILCSAILISLYTLATIRCGNSKAAFVATAAMFVLAAVSFNLRPQMLGYLFLILTFIVLEQFRQGNRGAIWALPVLMLIWVNAHGSWIIGIGVIEVYLACGLVEFRLGDVESKRWSPPDRLRLGIALALCGGATLITPYGAALAKFPFKVASSLPVSVANIYEWLPIPLNAASGEVFLACLLGLFAVQAIYRFKWRLEDLVLFMFAAAVACVHRRFLLIFVPVFTPVLATILARWVPPYDRPKDRHVLNAAIMAIVLACIVWYFPSQAYLLQNAGKTYPVAAVNYLNSHAVPGPMYNTYGFGGYLIFSRWPEHKVFLDGRSELYEQAGVLSDYLEIADIKPGAISMLQKYGFQSCLVNHDEALATVLAALPDWKKEYEDGTSVLFVRRGTSAASPALISKVVPDSGL